MHLILDNISSLDHGLCLYERPNIPTPKRDVEKINIRGRNGSLTKEYAWQDITFDVTLNILEDSSIKPDTRTIKQYILKAKTLKMSDESYYYQIIDVEMSDIQNEIEQYGLFTVSFSCKPFQCLDKTVAAITTSPSTVVNSGTVEADPVIKVTGIGNITLSVNGRGFLLIGITDYITIDSAMGFSYRLTAGMDHKTNGTMPYLDPGNNVVSWTGTVTKVEITYKEAYL